MATSYSEEEVRLASACYDLKRLQESCSDLLNFVDFTDAISFRQENGQPLSRAFRLDFPTAYGQALQRPSATACVYLNEQQLMMIQAGSRAFTSINPYWMAVKENRTSYVVGNGHIVTVMSKRKSQKLEESLKEKVDEEIALFQLTNQYRLRQNEKLARLDRDGEFFLRFIESRDDGILRVRFVEPILVRTPPRYGPEGGVWFGIQFNDEDYEEPIRYFIRPATYDGGLTANQEAVWRRGVLAEKIQHRKANVDMGSPRGIPSTYWLQDQCEQAVSTLKSMGKLVDIRARIALIVKQANATLGQIQPLLTANRIGQAYNGGRTLNVFGYPYGSIIHTNDQREYSLPAQNIETDKIVSSLKSDLQAVAAAMGLADFCISGDAKAAFANALVKEGPMDRAMGRLQQDMIDDDVAVYYRALKVAADHGRLPSDILDKVRIEIMPPQVIARERLVNTQADEILVRNGAMSPDTMAMRANLDPEDEREKAKANPSPQVISALAGPGGGLGDKRSMQPSLKGGSAGRGVPPGQEVGPGVNPSRAEKGMTEELQEAVASPTGEDHAMAELVLPESWRHQTKSEILGLSHTQAPPVTVGLRAQFEPGVSGVYLGIAAGFGVWAVDSAALAVAHDIDGFGSAGNCEHWPFLPHKTIVVDWAKSGPELQTMVYHEIVEAVLLGLGKWSYARAHRYSTYMERDWLVSLRPELQGV